MRLRRGIFVERVNRFLVKVNVKGKNFPAYLPNPGRLLELLVKGRKVIMRKNKMEKFPYTALFCMKDGNPVLLHTHLTKEIVKKLIEEKKISFLANYRVIKEEVRFDNSRFDLLLQKEGHKKLLLEVKTCTLFGKEVSMFPDAVSVRGRKHLYKLFEIAGLRYEAGCLFVVMNPYVKYFLPAYHIDPEFAKAFMEVRKKVHLWAISIRFSYDLRRVEEIKELKIPYNLIERENQNRGVYLLLLEITSPQKIVIGGLKEVPFKKGFYIYVGSAKRNLSQRIKRHLRKRKKLRWHIDYLTKIAKVIKTIPIRTSKNLECDIAKKLSLIAEGKICGFGAGDCSCETHLFYFSKNPFKNERFIEGLNFFMLDTIL